jgi:hypothetical protein
MDTAVADKIATHLAAIAAHARTKQAFDRFLQKKADVAETLAAHPMASGVGIGALGGGLLGGGSTAIANLFRKKKDRKSILNSALLGGVGGGALGLAGGALYSGANQREIDAKKGPMSQPAAIKALELANTANTARLKQIGEMETKLNVLAPNSPDAIALAKNIATLKNVSADYKRMAELAKDYQKGKTTVMGDATGGWLPYDAFLPGASVVSGAVGANLGYNSARRSAFMAAANDPNNKGFAQMLESQVGKRNIGDLATVNNHLKKMLIAENAPRSLFKPSTWFGNATPKTNVPNPSAGARGAPQTVNPMALRKYAPLSAGRPIMSTVAGGVAGAALPYLLDLTAGWAGINPETNRQNAATRAQLEAMQLADRLNGIRK